MSELDEYAREIAGLVVAGVPLASTQAWTRAIARDLGVATTAVSELVDRDGQRVLVLYQPPWQAFLEACATQRFADGSEAEAWLRDWQRFHEGVLQERDRAPERVVLVNAARLGAESLASLRADLGLADAGFDEVPPLATAEDAELLASRLEELAPECWEAYEAMESVALLLGREPEFRGASRLDRRLALKRSLASVDCSIATRSSSLLRMW